MRQRPKLSVTISSDIMRRLDALLGDSMYRNKSHLVEIALRRFVEEHE